MIPVNILVVDDEVHIVELIQFNLEINGYNVITAYDGMNALDKIKTNSFDLIILDIMLPRIDGLEICRFLRNDKRNKDVPIIMLTAKAEETDKIYGLEIGADDYVTKPFSIKELLARVKALLRRVEKKNTEGGSIELKNIVIDKNKHIVTVKDNELDLTLKEFEVLRVLAENRGKVLTRDFLLNNVWGYDYFGETRTVDVHIRHLRKKIEKYDKDKEYIQTIRGVGYKIR